jgi:hypothetical protein
MFNDLGATVATGPAGAVVGTAVATGFCGTAVGTAVGDAQPPTLMVIKTQNIVRLSSLFPRFFMWFLLNKISSIVGTITINL